MCRLLPPYFQVGSAEHFFVGVEAKQSAEYSSCL